MLLTKSLARLTLLICLLGLLLCAAPAYAVDESGGELGLLLRRWQVGFLADFDVGFNVFAVGHLAQLFSRQFF